MFSYSTRRRLIPASAYSVIRFNKSLPFWTSGQSWETIPLAIARLSELTLPTKQISSDLVVGDIVFLSSGDIAGADIRVIVCTAESVIDLSPLTQISHDFKKLKEKPTDLDPL